MKKTTLFILAAGALVFTTLPVNAQKKVTLEQVQKEAQQGQTTKAVTNPPGQATAIKPAAATKQVVAGAITTPPPANPAAAPAKSAAADQAAAPAPQAPAAPAVPLTCTWDVTDYDFGKNVTQLKPASATFNITNAGKEPVTITLVQPSCGCTSPKYTKEPIKPGEKGEVVLTYDAKTSGFFSKSATVKLNDGQKYMLTIKGEVQKVEPEAAPATIK